MFLSTVCFFVIIFLFMHARLLRALIKINDKNCSLSIVLTAMDQEQQKS